MNAETKNKETTENIPFRDLKDSYNEDDKYMPNNNYKISTEKILSQKKEKVNKKYKENIYLYKIKKNSSNTEIDLEDNKKDNLLVNNYIKNKSFNKIKFAKETECIDSKNKNIYLENSRGGKNKEIFSLLNSQNSKNILKMKLKLVDDYILKTNKMQNIKIANNYNNIDNNNKIHNNEKNGNKKYKNNYQKNDIYNNRIITSYNKYKSIQIIKNFIIYIILYQFYLFNSLLNSGMNKINKNIVFFSYEITLKVRDTGTRNILSSTSPYIYTCPSNIYLNDELIQSADLIDCRHIRINEINTNIKLVWTNVNIISTRGMFYQCTDITEIDMTNFNTSLVTDMTNMFYRCSFLKNLNVSNLDTSKVQKFEYMFYQCTSLTSLNLESFTNPSATSLYRMFYGCSNLEFINIKNFDEKQNINLNGMFSDIPTNAIICLSSCPPPTKLIIDSITTNEATISWEGHEWNKFIISYGLNPTNAENGHKLNVTDTKYTFKDLNINQDYDIYIKTDCDTKSSYWLGPLLVSIESYTMYHSGTHSITTCSKVIYDSGGPNKNYGNNANSALRISSSSSKILTIKGIINTERNYDFLYIYDGIDYRTFLGSYSGYGDIPLFVSTRNSFTIEFKSDSYNIYPGFELTVGNIVNSPQTIYNLIKSNSCQQISCDDNWKSIQIVSLSYLTNCQSTINKYQYRGICYNSCPAGTRSDPNNNYICYSNHVLDSCALYTIESEKENSCVKCKSNYYSIFGDKRNNNFVACYKNNSLDNYCLDNNDLLFKPCIKDCYPSCELCAKGGNIFNHKCIKCKSDYFYQLNFSSYLNCYKKIEFDFYYINKDEGKTFCYPDNNCNNYFNELKIENSQGIYDCNNFPNYPLEGKNDCYVLYPDRSNNNYNNCETKCPGNPNIILESKECVFSCSLHHIARNIYNLTDDNGIEDEQKMVVHIKKEIGNGIDISKVDKGEDIIILAKNITLTIKKYKINSGTDTTNINLEKCIEKLRSIYEFRENESFYILIMDVKQNGYKIPKIQYELYYPLNHDSKLYLLDLDICKDIETDVYLPVSLGENIDKFIPGSDFYNDICTTFTTENGTDLTISGRKDYYINNKLAICEENCNFVEYNRTTQNIVCSCKIKTDFNKNISENKFNEGELYKSFTDFYNIFNIKILQCMNLIFTADAFKQNYANIVLITIIALYCICLTFFSWKSYKIEIVYYIDIITYFSLFSKKIMYIIRKQEKKLNKNFVKLKKNFHIIKNKVIRFKKGLSNIQNLNPKNNINNKDKNLVIEGISIKPPIYNIVHGLKKSVKNNQINYEITQNENYQQNKKRNSENIKNDITHKINLDKIIDENIINKINNYNTINKLSEEQIYKLYKILYSRTDNELNDLPYKDALKYDKRTYFQFYFSLLKCNHLLFFSFQPKFDFNLQIIKMYLFFFSFATFFFVNALFFTDETMGKINTDGGSYNFIYNLPQILYSSIISAVIDILIKLLAISENGFIMFRNKVNKEKKGENIIKFASNLKRNFKIKFILFFIIDLIFLGCFWIYLSCFSAVYHNTQLHLIKDTLISFGTSFISPLGIYLLPGIFRIHSLKNIKRKIFYGISQILCLL